MFWSYLGFARFCRIAFWSVLFFAPAVGAQQKAVSPASINPSKLVDLSYTFDEKTIYWPNAEGFERHVDHWGPREDGGWYAAAHFSAAEHGGTHMDAPIHFAKGKRTLDQIPVSQLVAPAVVIDISDKCAGHPDYLLQPADVDAWEKVHGRVPAGSIALVRTGWGKFWPDKKQYMGTDVKGDTAHLDFPGIGPEAAKLLVSRGIVGVGLDTASMDYGRSKDFPTHGVINGADLYGLENVANMEKLPATGATLIALPMKIGGGTGAPTRVVAVLP
ncbi:MAG TPA: cyclase family protein [Terriglobales bacterium]|nr:cyclase family protein [Terriglobales bacterium]